MNEAIQVTIIMYFSFDVKNEDGISETYLKKIIDYLLLLTT